jgi:release factor glutamine methyltransferase
MRLLTPPGVFRPRSDSRLLARVAGARIRNASVRSVLDPFTGSGILAIAAALAGAPRVTAVDISRRAVACTWANARLNRVHVQAVRGDLFEPVDGERFDLIIANPPYVPGELSPSAARNAARAWEGGPDGRELIDRLCSQAPGYLSPDGELLLVHSSVCGRTQTEEALRAEGFAVEILQAQRGPLGPLLAARAQALRRNGLLPCASEKAEEELLVFAARLAPDPDLARNRDGSQPTPPAVSRARASAV